MTYSNVMKMRKRLKLIYELPLESNPRLTGDNLKKSLWNVTHTVFTINAPTFMSTNDGVKSH